VSWGEQEIFSRDTAAASIPEEWTRDGWIELPTGPMWQVVHAPTSQLLESLHEPAIPGVLIAGWLIAFLTAALIIQNGRVKRRAVEAETAERQVSRLNENLERQVESRTRELANRTSDLETISESVAHDLRNPLNTIGMNAALLQQEFGDGATPEIFESMAHATQRMVRILERLEGFSHATFTPFERQPIDMNALVDDVCEELAVAEANRSIRLQRQDLPNCTADRGMIRILLLNLISNSCKYTHSTPDPLVEIGADVDGGRVVYFVRDNGIGFAENRSDEMFKPFTRFDNGVAEGRGMGLAIAARIVQRHGGRIWAKSIPGAGATFYFELEAA
jgi:signal transduction histidine kinase